MDNLEVGKGRIVLEPLKADMVTPSGIILTVEADLPGKAIIRAVWEGHYDYDKWLKEGDIVVYNKAQSLRIMHEGKEYILTNEGHIYYKTKEKTN